MTKTRTNHATRTATLPLFATALVLAGCGVNATLPIDAGYGPNPTLPAPKHTLFPTVHIATAHGWPAGQTPQVASGLQIKAFASGLDHPRWLYTLPNGDVLVAETDAPPKPEDGKGLRGWIMGKVMKKCGLYAEMVSLALHELFDMDQPVESAPYYMDLLGPQPEPMPVDGNLPVLNRIKKNCMAVEQCVSFPARPNRFCGWCPYSKSNGGPCKL